MPLKAQGYRFEADLTEATLLTDDADVRISGVTVGHRGRQRAGGRASPRRRSRWNSKYAPIPTDTRVTLRQKTLDGETYVELTPGSPDGKLPEGGALPASAAPGHPPDRRGAGDVPLDPRTREALRSAVRAARDRSQGRGEDVNNALGQRARWPRPAAGLAAGGRPGEEALRRLVRDGGFVLESAARRQGELSALVRAGDRVLRTTARRNAELEETIRLLPTTLRELRPTLQELEEFAVEAAPVVRELRPAGPAPGPALVDASSLAPDLRGLFRDVDDVIDVAERALPATTRTVNAARPVFQELARALRACCRWSTTSASSRTRRSRSSRAFPRR